MDVIQEANRKLKHGDDDDDYDVRDYNDRKTKKKKKKSSSSLRSRDICLPPHGKTYLTIGQDLYSIQEYLREQENATLHWYMDKLKREEEGAGDGTNTTAAAGSKHQRPIDDFEEPRLPVPRSEENVPAAVMVYTDIQKLKGLEYPVDYGTGIEYAEGALRMASPPNNYLAVGLQVGLWLAGAKGCHDIISGKLDSQINDLVYYLGEKCSASKVFLRIGYEFDNPEFGYSTDPESYKRAFEYIVKKCQKKRYCTRKVNMVWHSWAAGLPSNATLVDFYPGDDVVDWIGVSVFQQFYDNGVGGTLVDLEKVLDFAAEHKKPTMIAESTPFGGIHNNPYIPKGAGIWEAWFAPTLHLIKEYDIAMWSYINCNWEVQPLWVGAGFGDTRLSIDAGLMDQWFDHVTSQRRFVRATDDELCGNDVSYYAYGDYEYKFYSDDDDDDMFHFQQQIMHHQRKKLNNKHYRYDDDDYYYYHPPGGKEMDSRHGRHHSKRTWWLWGNERPVESEGLWSAVLPLVMLSSSLAIIFFMYVATKRRVNRLERTPRAQRVRFAFLDAKEDGDDGSFALYGSINSMDDSENSRWRGSVRRVGPNLIVANTSDGTTIVA